MIPELNIIDSSEKRKTLGQQVYEKQTKYHGQKTQTVRETTDEMGKKYMESLWKVIEDHEYVREPYYIMEILRPDAILDGVIKLKHIARRTRPLPEWGISLYKVDNRAGTCLYEYGLPHMAEAYIMLQNPAGWDQKVIQDICDFVEGKLA